MGNTGVPPSGPIGGTMQDLVTTQKSGVIYLGQLIGVLKAAFIQFGGKTTSATSGAASALPATPAGYVSFTLPDGTIGKFPYYNN
jgi:hypothetical protein